jgi:hypothetical protein
MSTNKVVKPEDAVLINKPLGSGSAIKSFKLRENRFLDIAHGKYGGTVCTTVSFYKSGIYIGNEICFEGHVCFTEYQQVFKAISQDIALLISIIDKLKEANYENGYNSGIKHIQSQLKHTLGIY